MSKNKSVSIQARLVRPLMILLALQTLAMAFIVMYGGVSSKLKENSFYLLNESTENRCLSLEKETIHQWVNIVGDPDSVTTQIDNILRDRGKTGADISQDADLNREIVDGILEKSIGLLRRSYATGIFVVLDGPAAANSPDGTRAGFYVRDSNPGSYNEDYSSLLMERGLPSIASNYGITLDSFWELAFDVKGGDESSFYFTKPFELASENAPGMKDCLKFAHLSRPFRLSKKDMKVVTYSVPLVLQDKTVAGVFGVEMSLGHLEQLMASEKTGTSDDKCYVLGVRKAGETAVTPIAASGYLYNQYFAGQDEIACEDSGEKGMAEVLSSDHTKWYASVKELDIYDYSTPFDEDEWVLMGIARQKDLLSFPNNIIRMLMISILVSVILCGIGIFGIGKLVTDPIRFLIKELRGKSGVPGLSLTRVHISEIDELTETIEQLSYDVERSASKIATILEHSRVLIGVFEYPNHLNQVFLSRSAYEILGWPEIKESFGYLPKKEFEDLMYETMKDGYRDSGYVLCHIGKSDGGRWVKLILEEEEDDGCMGVLIDVTADVEEKKKLERERNFDLLTDLYNRRAFREEVQGVLGRKVFPVAAIVMWDLDNLKYINDTYGHDEGDRYIVLFAQCLKRLETEGGIVSRYSGDEFVTMLYGNQKEEIQKRLRKFMKMIQNTRLKMEEGYEIPIRVSGGAAWYPENSGDFDTLINYADFAMYTVKHSVKGILMEFDAREYSNNSYMLAGREELNRMLETKEVDFAFQPIVRRDGRIYGYEILMRPDLKNLKGIQEVLNLARAQAKLPQMEFLTWKAGLTAVQKQDFAGVLGKDERIFINSIASVCMTEAELQQLEEEYGEYLSRIVTEMTEGEPVNREFMEYKISKTRAWKGLIAIDDYGAGYNSETVLLTMRPDIVKIDMSLVEHIDQDANRQMIMKNFIRFAEQNQITVLAEGVETVGELEYLMECGVELFQGYYIARPQMEIRPIDPFIVGKMQEIAEKSGISHK